MRIPPRIISVTALAAALLVGGSVTGTATAAPQTAAASHSIAVTAPAGFSAAAVGDICYSDLPSQAHDTLRLIDKGGPYPYPQDGTVFQNREGILPKQNTGYYHEFTVKTPGSPNRGARRIVTGNEQQDYYTADHYRSFDLVDHSC
ncbi:MULTISPECIES: ribonuclease domain-containing protein [Streptomyces]|uniref:Ribonuclease N1 n=1 Tax=Streptomyces lasiicapitis TaxID=1923961 RepID=A0ABQ2LLT3_9ACTN|nr:MULTISPECIES: ribonuclease domain-containing protein [Streptomyces]QIB42751.1 ribonuclease [Streptomyces aureoverticillatus]GGO39871.1 ribonuclease N1 [Streptomyces lasiicapitis]